VDSQGRLGGGAREIPFGFAQGRLSARRKKRERSG